MHVLAKIFSLPAVLASAALAVAGCAGPTVDDRAPAAPAAQPAAPVQPVPAAGPAVVGLLVPLTTSDPGAAQIAEAMVNAARLAIADSGSAGIQLEVYDTAGSPERAASAARQAVNDGAQVLVGPLFAGTTRAVAPVAAQAGINVISFSTDSTVAGDPVYLSGYLPEAEARRIAAFASRRNFRNVAVYYPQTSYGEAAIRGMQQAASRTGMNIVAQQGYPRSFEGIKNTAGPFAEEAKANGAQAVLLADGGQGLRSIGAFMAYRGVSSDVIQYMGLGQWNSPTTLEERSLKGGVFPAPDPEQVRAFLNRYSSQFGGRPPVLSVLGYDGVSLAAQMLGDARQNGGAPFADARLARTGGWNGAFGPIRFFSDGTSERGMAVLIVTDNGFEVMEPAPRSYGAGL